jgi:hypothetical protein
MSDRDEMYQNSQRLSTLYDEVLLVCRGSRVNCGTNKGFCKFVLQVFMTSLIAFRVKWGENMESLWFDGIFMRL